VAAALRQPDSALTRRAFLFAACGGLLALAVGRRLVDAGERGTLGGFIPKRADNLIEEPRGAGLALRPTPIDDQGPTFRLNGPGAFVWRRIDGKRSVNVLAAQLGAAYGLTPAAARTDTLTFLGSMMQIGLVFDPAGRRTVSG
jgi:hypothetical protein